MIQGPVECRRHSCAKTGTCGVRVRYGLGDRLPSRRLQAWHGLRIDPAALFLANRFWQRRQPAINFANGGVVENGLFVAMTHLVVVGEDDGSSRLIEKD